MTVIGVIARNMFIDWFGGSLRTTRGLLSRVSRKVHIELIPIVDEAYWLFRMGHIKTNVVYKWLSNYSRLKLHVNEHMLAHYVKGDLHKCWSELMSRYANKYDIIYDPIIMPISIPFPSANQLKELIAPQHPDLTYLKHNPSGKLIILPIGSGDVPHTLTWVARIIRKYLSVNPRRVIGLKLFIAKSRALFNSLIKYKDRVLVLIPSLGVIRNIPMLKKMKSRNFFPFYALDERAFEVSISRKEDNIIFFARLDLTKGILEVPKILQQLRTLGLNVTMKIIGKFEDLKTERAFWKNVKALKVNNMIKYLGFIPEDKKILAFRELASSTLFVYPTHADVVPNVVLEALALKTPVVMYDIPGPYEVFKGTTAVHFVEEFNIRAMAVKVYEILCKVREYNELFDVNAIRIVKLHSTWNPIVKRFVGIVESLLRY